VVKELGGEPLTIRACSADMKSCSTDTRSPERDTTVALVLPN